MEKIERKFLVKEMPDISHLEPFHYERYILTSEAGEKRIQKVGERYELEELEASSDLTRHSNKKTITKDEFKRLKQKSVASIKRDSYQISRNPNISIKVYQDVHKGLVRTEVEFKSEDEARNFKPLDWMGKEITTSPLGRDAKLVKLSKEEFASLIKET